MVDMVIVLHRVGWFTLVLVVCRLASFEVLLWLEQVEMFVGRFESFRSG